MQSLLRSYLRWTCFWKQSCEFYVVPRPDEQLTYLPSWVMNTKIPGLAGEKESGVNFAL